ncbi:lantibiotic ABC transporter permease [Vallitalea longa]|uniref:Lantibiotic ABC transporter permease n=1 Tax=Vallitalea longa TaxID=2936439 RepID=A0A9W5YDM9_9FIRM|nr:lantibiotic immunity ABC transporter MutE/EpiE family permease subunit [Vallitalea longa]GKX31572.1 lantibiotic ABC transporter permease [Vallitalea longa]
MKELVFAEYQKYKRTFTKKLIWLAPTFTLLISILLGLGRLSQQGSYNWWCLMILPGTITLICVSIAKKDKRKLNYRSILSLPISPETVWLGKIGTGVFLHFITCSIFFLGVTIGGVVFGSSISLLRSAAGSMVLFITFLWQIPLCMFLSERLGLFLTVGINIAANMISTIFISTESSWWIPYAIPSRLMCPIIKVMPNGLSVPPNDPLLSTSVILPGILITLIMFVVLSLLTELPYRKLEAK